MIQRELDSNADGATDSVQTWDYDVAGRLREIRDYVPPDELSRRSVFTYESQALVEYADWLADGTLTSRYWYRYDERGRLTYEVSDYDADGHGDYLWHHLYDGEVLTGSLYDNEGDGSYDRIWIRRWQAGRQVQWLFDDELDGVFDSVTDFTYDSVGRLTSMVHRMGEARLGDRVEYQYGLEGWLRREDSWRGESWDRTTQYDYDDEGRVVELLHTDHFYPTVRETAVNDCG